MFVIDSKTHNFVTKYAIELLDIPEFNEFKEPIVFYSVQPDIDEKECVFKNHFYNPATRKNFIGERQSAMTKYIEHYNNASSLASSDSNYYEQLGRCSHFLVDMNTPVHTYYEDLYDAATKLSNHVKFENYCNNIIDSINVTVNKDYLNSFIYNSTKDIAKNCVRISNILLYEYKNNPKQLDIIAKHSIENSIKAVAGLLHKFYVEALS